MIYGEHISIERMGLMTVTPEMVGGQRIDEGTEVYLESPDADALARYYPTAAEQLRGRLLPDEESLMKPEGLAERIGNPDHLTLAFATRERQVGIVSLLHFNDLKSGTSERPVLSAHVLSPEAQVERALAMALAVGIALKSGKEGVLMRTPHGNWGTVFDWDIAASLGMKDVNYRVHQSGAQYIEYSRGGGAAGMGDLPGRCQNHHAIEYRHTTPRAAA